MSERNVPDDDLLLELRRLGQKTDGLAPRADFNARVMSAIANDVQKSTRSDFAKPARHVIPFAALLAALSLVWAVRSESVLDDTLAGDTDVTVELEW